jgi:transposase-like protein
MGRARSLFQFQKDFPDEQSCAEFIFERRWPDGFTCPACDSGRACLLKSRAFAYECIDCGRQTSITAGTIMHRSKLPLTVWFWAAHLMVTHSNGISALQLMPQIGLSYRTAWLLTQKLRRSMVDPDRSLLTGLVEVDQTEMPFRTKASFFNSDLAKKIIVIGAVEVVDRTTGKTPRKRAPGALYLHTRSGRVRLATIPDNTAASIHAFVRANVAPGSTLITDGHKSYLGLSGYTHDPWVVTNIAGHIPLPWIHRVFSLMKRWGLGTYHGLRRKHIETYLNEFVFRFNRRFYRHVSFETILGIASHRPPTGYWDIVGRANPRKGEVTLRKSSRLRKTATGMKPDGQGRSHKLQQLAVSPASAAAMPPPGPSPAP